jgi:hypothetical protein
MQKEQMKTFLSVIVSTATFFSARCESSKPERRSVPDPTLAALRAATAPDHVEIPTPVESPSELPTIKWPLALQPIAPAPTFEQLPLHAGSLSSATQRTMLLAL